MNIGGKALTNYLKEVVSYRHWNVMDETYLMNLVKERLCFVSTDFAHDLEITHLPNNLNTIRAEYVLPDYVTNHTGYVKERTADPAKKDPQEQILVMNNERLIVPELLFNPSDIGIKQAGIPEAIVQCVEGCVQEMSGLLYNNILVCGGNTLFPNFAKRL